MKISLLAIAVMALAASACRTTASDDEAKAKDFSQVNTVVRLPDGRFSVACQDGTSQIATLAQVSANDVCGSKPGAICAPARSSTGVFRVSDNAQIGGGGFNDSADCQKAAAASASGAICTPVNSFSVAMTNIATDTTIGQGTFSTIDDCVESMRFARTGVACIPHNSFSVNAVRLSDNKVIGGSYDKVKDCNTALSAIDAGGIFCNPVNSFTVAIIRVTDGSAVGGTFSKAEECQAAVRAASNGLLCSPRNSFTFVLMRVASGAAVGSGTFSTMKECLQAAGAAAP